MNRLVLVGFGGHGLSVLDSIQRAGSYEIIGYTDLHNAGDLCSLPWLGTDDSLEEIYRNGCKNAFITIGFLGKGCIRNTLYEKLKSIGFHLPVIRDPSAIISNDVHIGEGTFIGKNVVVNSGSHIGEMTIINTGALIEHSNMIGAFSHVSTGAVLCGDITTGRDCFIGAGSVIIQGLTIGDHSIVGAGSTVLKDVPADNTVYGLWKH